MKYGFVAGQPGHELPQSPAALSEEWNSVEQARCLY